MGFYDAGRYFGESTLAVDRRSGFRRSPEWVCGRVDAFHVGSIVGLWIPAFAGMGSWGVGMSKWGAGMVYGGGAIYGDVAEGAGKFGVLPPSVGSYVVRQNAVPCPTLDCPEGCRTAERPPHLAQLYADQSAEGGMGDGACEVVSAGADGFAVGVVSTHMVQGDPHKLGEGDRASVGDSGAYLAFGGGHCLWVFTAEAQ